MWDKHWCRGATERVGLLVEKMEPVLEAARKSGITIIHAPSDTMSFYENAPQRKRMQTLAPSPRRRPQTDSPPVPVDSAGGGCDTPPDAAVPGLDPRAPRPPDCRRRLHLRQRRGDLSAAQAEEHPAPARHGRAHQHVRAQPQLRHQADDRVGRALHPGPRPDGCHVQPGGSSPTFRTSGERRW